MKFTLGWLKNHLDTNASLMEISEKLTSIGLEVESVTDRSEELAPFTVAKILHAEKHPEADKLRVCKVQSDVGELQIVCGAPNARDGLFVALAKEGAKIPASGMIIKKTNIRGVESNGMLCSADELALGSDAEGIIELPETKIGTPIAEALGLNDPVIEIAITPNRGDCLGVRGIARDLAAAGLGSLKPLPDVSKFKGSFVSPVSVAIKSPACPQFIGCAIKDVENTQSPDWLKNQLAAIGQKPISSLVDITNYFTFDLGRPLHVYDTAKLKGNISVRSASDKENFTALNGKTYTLTSGMGGAVIADDSGAIGVGGIIGGQSTSVDENTREIFLEIALFDSIEVAKTGRALQIESDARYRFERGVDVDFVETGAMLAIRMITELCGGTASELVLAGKTPDWQRSIKLRTQRIADFGGITIEPKKVQNILQSLGFSCAETRDGFEVSPPSWRTDVEGEADLIEEVLRIEGYDKIPPASLPKLPTISRPAISHAQKQAQLARRQLASRGFLECCTWSFLPEAQAKLFGGGNAALKLLNPISAELDMMRPSLLPNLLQAAKHNLFRGLENPALFEVGLQYHDTSPNGQRMIAAGLRIGTHTCYTRGEQFQKRTPPLDAFDAKSEALAVLQTLGMQKCDVTTDTPAWYHPGRSGALTLGGKVIMGYFGEIHPAMAASYDLEDRPVTAFEIFLDAIPEPRKKTKARPPLKLSDYQAVSRDFAFIVDENVTAAEIIKAINRAEKQLITDVEIFDVYAGKGVETGKKSVAVNVTLQAMDRTLTDDEINGVAKTIVETAKSSFGGLLRQ